MTEARIIEKTIGHPSGEDFTFYDVTPVSHPAISRVLW